MKVIFQKSKLEVEWDPEAESLLELAEDNGLNPGFSCRKGCCTVCEAPLLKGEVQYPRGHEADPDEGHALICCSIPKKDQQEPLILDI